MTETPLSFDDIYAMRTSYRVLASALLPLLKGEDLPPEDLVFIRKAMLIMAGSLRLISPGQYQTEIAKFDPEAN